MRKGRGEGTEGREDEVRGEEKSCPISHPPCHVQSHTTSVVQFCILLPCPRSPYPRHVRVCTPLPRPRSSHLRYVQGRAPLATFKVASPPSCPRFPAAPPPPLCTIKVSSSPSSPESDPPVTSKVTSAMSNVAPAATSKVDPPIRYPTSRRSTHL